MLGNSEVLMGQAPLFELPLERVVTVAFRIPYPPSVNTIYRHRVMGKKVVTYKTPEHRTYVDAVGSSVRYAGLRNPMIDTLPFVGNVSLIVRLFRPRKAGDIDNRMKALFDSLNGVAWKDDSQVVELHVYRREDKDDPRAELEIEGVP
jgi:Holliday junction resolvase RusA-like endonuclease